MGMRSFSRNITDVEQVGERKRKGSRNIRVGNEKKGREIREIGLRIEK